MRENISVVVVNWNGYKDTIECVSSLIDLEFSGQLNIMISDNDSSDGSVDHLNSWLASISNAPRTGQESFLVSQNCNITLLQNSDNLGYAGGNNAGIKYALKHFDPEFVWILNNDVSVDKHALSALIHRMKLDPAIGMCGSTLLYYDSPEYVQAYGGCCYSAWSGRGKHIGSGERFADRTDYANALLDADVDARLSYISGASMFVSRSFLDKVGLMNEEYFLYCEELDWARRAKGLFKFGFAPQAIVYHKEGASIGTVTKGKRASLISEFYQTRNKLRFTKKYYPLYLPTVWLVMFVHAQKRFISGQPENGKVMLKALFGQTDVSPEWTVRRSE